MKDEDIIEDELIDGEMQDDQEDQEKDEPKESLKGYLDKEAWIAAGKDPDEWVSPEVFKERTLRINESKRLHKLINKLEEDFDNRVKNLNTLTARQISRMENELRQARDSAIDIADRDAVKRIDGELDELRKNKELLEEDEKPKLQKPPEVIEWEEENPWIVDPNDPRTPVARAAFADARESGKTYAYALRMADKAIADIKVTPRKRPPLADQGSGLASRNDGPALTWGQLSHEEKEMYDEFYSDMPKKDYLQAVVDARRGK